MDEGLLDAQAALLAGADADRQFAAEALALPSEAYVADQMAVADPDAIHAAGEFLRGELGRHWPGAARHLRPADRAPAT